MCVCVCVFVCVFVYVCICGVCLYYILFRSDHMAHKEYHGTSACTCVHTEEPHHKLCHNSILDLIRTTTHKNNRFPKNSIASTHTRPKLLLPTTATATTTTTTITITTT